MVAVTVEVVYVAQKELAAEMLARRARLQLSLLQTGTGVGVAAGLATAEEMKAIRHTRMKLRDGTTILNLLGELVMLARIQ